MKLTTGSGLILLLLCVLAVVTIPVSASTLRTGDFVVSPGGEASGSLLLEGVPSGIAAYDLLITVKEPESALITKVEYPAWTVFSSRPPVPAASARIMAISEENAPNSSITLATVTIEGIQPGKTALNITVKELKSPGGAEIPVLLSGGAITVEGISQGDVTLTPVRNSPEESGRIPLNQAPPTIPTQKSPGFTCIAAVSGLGIIGVVFRRMTKPSLSSIEDRGRYP